MPEVKARPYVKRRRADDEARTRERIVEAAVGLHGSVGPSRTTISAIAERAGVQRLTVYRHFPDQHALFAACSAHWLARNPPPDLDAWARITDPRERLRRGLREWYAFYERGEEMIASLLRDEDVAATGLPGPSHFAAAAASILGRGWGARGAARRRLDAALRLATAFATWRSLVRDGRWTSRDAAAFMHGVVAQQASGHRAATSR